MKRSACRICGLLVIWVPSRFAWRHAVHVDDHAPIPVQP